MGVVRPRGENVGKLNFYPGTIWEQILKAKSLTD